MNKNITKKKKRDLIKKYRQIIYYDFANYRSWFARTTVNLNPAYFFNNYTFIKKRRKWHISISVISYFISVMLNLDSRKNLDILGPDCIEIWEPEISIFQFTNLYYVYIYKEKKKKRKPMFYLKRKNPNHILSFSTL